MDDPQEDVVRETEDVQQLAAIDLGSNSFHMVIGAADAAGDLRIVDRLREPVRLASGLDEQGFLSGKVVERALDCLARFEQRLRAVPRVNLRVVGTNTLRRAKNAQAFLKGARALLRVPIEVLPGAEEARLIYLGVAHDLYDDERNRLVVDIGGGSTECIIGRRFEAAFVDSLQMGCVTFTQRYFPEGKVTREAFKKAEVAARLELNTIQANYERIGWSESVGSSGTIRSVEEVLRTAEPDGGGITLDGLRWLKKRIIACGSTSKLAIEGLSTDRVPVFAGGVAVLKAVFQSLGIERMIVSQYALREGLLYDLLGRIRHEDVRDRTIQSMSERYQIDRAQAARVEKTALELFESTDAVWKLGEEGRRMLLWAARLHEIGLALRHSGYHKHGEYILANSNMPGFSREEQRLLARLVRVHRRKITTPLIEELPSFQRELAARLILLLRIAARMHRGRGAPEIPAVRCTADAWQLKLAFPAGWLDEHPLLRVDLEREAKRIAPFGYHLELA